MKLREELGADHPFVTKDLGKKSPEELAQELVKTKLYDVKLREQLWQGGRDAVLASTDPMIQFARVVDPDARAIRKWHDEEVETLETVGAERVAAAKFELEGKSNYPDATFTLRLSYGAVKGYEENGHHVNPLTTIGGAFERATGRDPFRLPESWLRANENRQLNLTVPFNMCTTNDIIGGNSGSPVFDKDLQIVGVSFDCNIEGLAADFWYDESVNRMVAVSSAAIIHALANIYHADRIVAELGARK